MVELLQMEGNGIQMKHQEPDSKKLAQDLPALHHQVIELHDKMAAIKEHVSRIRSLIPVEVQRPEAGISLLELKLQLLLSYVINCMQLVMTKLTGNPIQSTPTIHRIVELRTVLEKIRPLDQKLKYQIDKLVKTATTGIASSSDPLRFKPNPSNLVSKVEVDSSSDQDEKPSLDPKLYVPPRVVSAPYNENPGQKGRKRRQSALIAELKEEVLDMPSEVKTAIVVGGLQRQKELDKEKDLERFEERNMMRLFRKRKSLDTGRSNQQELDDLAEFSGLKFIAKDVQKYPSQNKKTKNFKK